MSASACNPAVASNALGTRTSSELSLQSPSGCGLYHSILVPLILILSLQNTRLPLHSVWLTPLHPPGSGGCQGAPSRTPRLGRLFPLCTALGLSLVSHSSYPNSLFLCLRPPPFNDPHSTGLFLPDVLLHPHPLAPCWAHTRDLANSYLMRNCGARGQEQWAGTVRKILQCHVMVFHQSMPACLPLSTYL